jgi:hypothetical protein
MKHEMRVFVLMVCMKNEEDVYQIIEQQDVHNQSHKMQRNEGICTMQV